MKHSDIVSVEEEDSFVEDENYATMQSLLSVENQDPEIIMMGDCKHEKQKAGIHFHSEAEVDTIIQQQHSAENGCGHDPVKMLLNQPKRSSLKKSCLLQSRKVGSLDFTNKSSPGICEVSSDDEFQELEPKLISNVFENRRKSCHSWRLKQKEKLKEKRCSTVSTESQVFEIIHLDDNNEEVSRTDKLITGSLILATLFAVSYLFWAQNASNPHAAE